MERDMSQSTTYCRSGCGFYGNPATDGLCSKCFKESVKRKQAAPSQGSSSTGSSSVSNNNLLMSAAQQQPSSPPTGFNSVVPIDAQSSGLTIGSSPSSSSLGIPIPTSSSQLLTTTPSSTPAAEPSSPVTPSLSSSPGYSLSYSPNSKPLTSFTTLFQQASSSIQQQLQPSALELEASGKQATQDVVMIDSRATAAATPTTGPAVPGTDPAAPTDPASGTIEAAKQQPGKKAKSRCGQCKAKIGIIGYPCRCGQTFCAQHRYASEHSCSFDYKAHGQSEIQKNLPKVVGAKIDQI